MMNRFPFSPSLLTLWMLGCPGLRSYNIGQLFARTIAWHANSRSEKCLSQCLKLSYMAASDQTRLARTNTQVHRHKDFSSEVIEISLGVGVHNSLPSMTAAGAKNGV